MSAAAKQPLLLYTASTPNGHKASIFLEELKAIYGLDYEYASSLFTHTFITAISNDILLCHYRARRINLGSGEQKEPWYIALNPNGRIPCLVDRNRNDFAVFESAAILLYLAQHYDTQNKFAFDPVQKPDDYSQMLQWVFFTVSDIHSGEVDEGTYSVLMVWFSVRSMGVLDLCKAKQVTSSALHLKIYPTLRNVREPAHHYSYHHSTELIDACSLCRLSGRDEASVRRPRDPSQRPRLPRWARTRRLQHCRYERSHMVSFMEIQIRHSFFRFVLKYSSPPHF